jgi:hypothetical protein
MMSDPLFEIYHRIAKTPEGKEMLEWERSLLWTDAYGAMYMSLRNGQEFTRLAYSVREE